MRKNGVGPPLHLPQIYHAHLIDFGICESEQIYYDEVSENNSYWRTEYMEEQEELEKVFAASIKTLYKCLQTHIRSTWVPCYRQAPWVCALKTNHKIINWVVLWNHQNLEIEFPKCIYLYKEWTSLLHPLGGHSSLFEMRIRPFSRGILKKTH